MKVTSVPVRSMRSWVWAAMSVLALVGVVITIPILLALSGGWPFAHLGYGQLAGGMASRHPFDPGIVAHWLSRGALIVAWISWAWMTLCVVLELRSWVTGRMPVRLPGSRTLQSLAACLVGTALAVSVAGRAGPTLHSKVQPTPAAVGPLPAGLRVIDDLDALGSSRLANPISNRKSAPTPNTSELHDSADQSDENRIPKDRATDLGRVLTGPTEIVHQVVARETLWSIATDQLGSSLRWREVADLNYGVRQADGGTLDGTHWIRPGWRLLLPMGGGGGPAGMTGAPIGDRSESGSAASLASDRTKRHVRGEPLIPVGGSVVGAGVISILDRMRRAQQRNRTSGRLIKLPDRPRRLIEQRLRIGDGAAVTSMIDGSLHSIGRQWRNLQGELPVIKGVRIHEQAIELVVDGLDTATQLPEGFVSGDDVGSIFVDWPNDRRSDATPSSPGGARSPAPLLVTAGRGDDGIVMVNLEALGSLVIEGEVEERDEVVRALALELATSRWGGHFELVLVGFGAELERFDGVQSTSEVAELVRALCRRRIEAHQALASAGYRSFGEGRLLDGSDRWDPIIVICGANVDDSDVVELLDAGCDPQAGMAVVAAGSRQGATHSVSFSGNGSPSSLELLGSVVFPQRVEVGELADVSALLEVAAGRESVLSSDEPYVHLTVPMPAPSRPVPPLATGAASRESVPPPERSTDGSPPQDPGDDGEADGQVLVKVLGPVEIVGADREFTRAWAKELVVYLSMHPHGSTNEAWATALWPDRLMAPSSLHSTASVARRALGKGPDGIDHLPRCHGRLQLSPTVMTDWARFSSLAESNGPAQWKSALQLVRGRPFEGLRSSDWPILEGIGPAIEASVVDLSGRLAGACLAAGDSRGAEWSARKGLLVSPYDERLYRMLMRAADLGGNPAGVESVMAELVRLVADDVEPFDSVHPSTIDLYRSLTRRGAGALTRR